MTPVCLQHGIMRWDPVLEWWLCHGYHGEGCLTAMMVTDEQARTAEPLPGVRYEPRAA